MYTCNLVRVYDFCPETDSLCASCKFERERENFTDSDQTVFADHCVCSSNMPFKLPLIIRLYFPKF